MSDKFLGGGSSNVNLSNGTATIFGASIGAINLDPSQPLKTNSVRQLVSSKLDIADINALQSTLNTKIGTPFIGTIKATDFETDDYFSVNAELQKTDNFMASTQSPEITNIDGLTKSTEVATGRVYDLTQSVWVNLDNDTVAVSATNLTFNANDVVSIDTAGTANYVPVFDTGGKMIKGSTLGFSNDALTCGRSTLTNQTDNLNTLTLQRSSPQLGGTELLINGVAGTSSALITAGNVSVGNGKLSVSTTSTTGSGDALDIVQNINTTRTAGSLVNIEGTTGQDALKIQTGRLNMNNEGRIINLPDPVNNQDAATKKYVDDNAGGGGVVNIGGGTNNFVPLYDGFTGNIIKNSNLQFESNTLLCEMAALSSNSPTFTTLTIQRNVPQLGGTELRIIGQPGTSSIKVSDGNFDMENGKTTLYTSSNSGEGDALSVVQLAGTRVGGSLCYMLGVSNTDTLKINLGHLNMTNGGRIINLPDPVNNQDAATKKYVDNNVGMWKEIPFLMSNLQVLANSYTYYMTCRSPITKTIKDMEIQINSGSDTFRVAIYTGFGLGAVLKCQSPGVLVSSFTLPTTFQLVAQPGQDLEIVSEGIYTIGISQGGTSARPLGITSLSDINQAWFNTTDVVASGFPINPQAQSATTIRICFSIS